MLRRTSRRLLGTGVATLGVVATSLTAVPATATAATSCTTVSVSVAGLALPPISVRKCTGMSPNGNGAWLLEEPAVYDSDSSPTHPRTLLLYSHGFRAADSTDRSAPDFPQARSELTSYFDPLTHYALLFNGYAIAGSAYGRNGWAVNDGVRADVELLTSILPKTLKHKAVHTYAWGSSLGGLITEMLAETHPSLLTAAAPMCGVLAGSVPLADHFLDVEVAAKTYFYPKLKLSGYTSDAQATAQVAAVENAVSSRLQSSDPAVAGAAAGRLIALDVLLGLPLKTFAFNNEHSQQSMVLAAAESFLTQVGYGIEGYRDVARRTGGQPTSNIGVDYKSYATKAARNRLASYGFSGSLLTAVARTLQTFGARVKPNAAARAKFATLGMPTGNLRVKTVTMHTEYDPLVIVSNERVFNGRVSAQGKAAKLSSIYVAPPAGGAWGLDSPTQGPGEEPALFGAGHCQFSPVHYLALVQALDTWTVGGTKPTAAVYRAITDAITANPALGLTPEQVQQLHDSVDLGFTPPAWPRPGVH